ncbi:MAG: YkgJ family cysteine cluster protein [Betaproteobacteria bacterium]|nr:YkgJ family cysteine cluster protein [Betaproteobacteria bacterium]MDE2309858.1 YkgJ family cysteine cluster protein [Betaproteobacteria bacterium]
MSDNPCLSCGACCAHLRVSFYWTEADDAPGGQVPARLTERVHAHLRCMKGTNEKPPRCIALQGEIGRQVACAIYELRPSPCREFNVLEQDGTPNERCRRLRAQAGLTTQRIS